MTIQEVLQRRNKEAAEAIDRCAATITGAAEYQPSIERRDSALYRLLRSVYFEGRNAGEAITSEHHERKGGAE